MPASMCPFVHIWLISSSPTLPLIEADIKKISDIWSSGPQKMQMGKSIINSLSFISYISNQISIFNLNKIENNNSTTYPKTLINK